MWVVVDRLTKFAHFLAVKTSMSLEQLAKLYIDQIVRFHGVLITNVSDRDLVCGALLEEFTQGFLTKLTFSTAFHP